jgi:hypothetical protein
MRLGRVVDWKAEVFPTWRRAANNLLHPNADIWGTLPVGVCWFRGEIEAEDPARMFVIGSDDWGDMFTTYRVDQIQLHDTDDMYQHSSRIRRMKTSMEGGWLGEPLILVACHSEGHFVVIDGNHRAVALSQLGRLVGRPCYIGFHASMETEFEWWPLPRWISPSPK